MPNRAKRKRVGKRKRKGAVQWEKKSLKHGEESPPVYKGDRSPDDAGDGYKHVSDRIRLPPDPGEKGRVLTLVWLGPPGSGKTAGALTFADAWHCDDPNTFNCDTAVVIICEDLMDAIQWIHDFGLELTYYWIIVDDALDKQDGRTAGNRDQISMLNIYEKIRHYFPGMRGTRFIISYTTQIDTLDPRIRNNSAFNFICSNPGDFPRRQKLFSMFGNHPWLRRRLGRITRDFRNEARGGAARGEFVYWSDVPEYGFFSLVKYHNIRSSARAPEIIDLRKREMFLRKEDQPEEVEVPAEVSLFPLVERVGERIGWGQKEFIVRTEVSRIVGDGEESEEIRTLAKKALKKGIGATKEYYKTLSVEHKSDTAKFGAMVKVLLGLKQDTFYHVRDEICQMLGDDLALFSGTVAVARYIRNYARALGRELGLCVHKNEKVRHKDIYYLVLSESGDVDVARMRAIETYNGEREAERVCEDLEASSRLAEFDEVPDDPDVTVAPVCGTERGRGST